MVSGTKDISIKMVKWKELEYEYGKMMARRKLENGTRINYINASRFTTQVATVIGGNTRLNRKKDMEHLRALMETDTSGNGCRNFLTAMEYSDGQMEVYIMDNRNKIREMVMDTTGG